MADEVDEGIENALNLVVLTTESSGNMKKDLKQTIFETVSTLRNLFVKLKNNCEVKSSKIIELEAEVTKEKTEIQRFTNKALKVQGAPSVIPCQEPAGPRVHAAPSVTPRQGPAGLTVREGAPSGGSERKLYSEVLANKIPKNKFQLTVKSNDNLPPDTIKGLLKIKINPTEIKVGIYALSRVLMETKSKKELEALEKDINAKCDGQLEATAHKLRNPRLVIISIPEGISIGNVEDNLLAQNTDVNLKEGDKSQIQLRNKKTQ